MSTPRSPESASALRAWLLSALLVCSLGQAATVSPAEERQQLLAQQQEMSAHFDRELATCRARFLVNDCIDGVNRQRRVALAPIRERLLQIDEAERQRRTAVRREALAAKQQIRDERMAAAVAAAQAASSASAPAPRQRMLPPAMPQAPTPQSMSKEVDRQQAAGQRVREAQRRQNQAAERQARVARRLAEREAKKGPQQPLPAPAAASGSR